MSDTSAQAADPDPSGTPFPRAVVVILVVLAGLLVAGVGTIGILFGGQPTQLSTSDSVGRTGPLALPPVPAPAADSADCTRLVAALPGSMRSGADTLTRRDLVAPAPVGALAWGSPHSDPVVLRCGLERPAELTPTAELLDVSGVRWLRIPGDDTVTWLAVDRPVYVALTEPATAGTGPLQDISTTVRGILPAKPVDAQPLSPEPSPTH